VEWCCCWLLHTSGVPISSLWSECHRASCGVYWSEWDCCMVSVVLGLMAWCSWSDDSFFSAGVSSSSFGSGRLVYN